MIKGETRGLFYGPYEDDGKENGSNYMSNGQYSCIRREEKECREM